MWEEEIVEADNVDEAFDKVGCGDSLEVHFGDFHDYYDEEYELIDEQINDPLVNMVREYGQPYQYELFENIS